MRIWVDEIKLLVVKSVEIGVEKSVENRVKSMLMANLGYFDFSAFHWNDQNLKLLH